MRILKLFIFIFIFLISPPVYALLDTDCPNSFCGRNYYPIKYPFKLQDQQPKKCRNYINLTCSLQNVTLLNIPFSGDFQVSSIDYFSRSIILRDPGNCLAKRLMDLNLSSSPFSAEYSEKFSFYNCPVTNLTYGYGVTRINCLSVSPNVTVASSEIPPEVMKMSFGCSVNVTKEIPIAYYGGTYDTFSNLRLKWNVPSCGDCEDFYPHRKDDTKNNTPNLIGLIIVVPLAIIVAFLVASYKRVSNARASIAATTEAAQPQQTASSTTTSVQPVSVEDRMVSDGQQSMLKTMIYSTFLEGNFGSLEGQDQGSCCSICLEDFSPQDMIRCLTSCSHYFHSQCIDLWFQDNSSCPVCRNSIFDP